jgi:hypothetical protein
MALVAQIARVADGLVDVVRRVGGREGALVVRTREHLPADALHGDERVAHDLAVLAHVLLLVLLPHVAGTLGLGVVGTQVPGQWIERLARSQGHDVTLSHRALHDELHL